MIAFHRIFVECLGMMLPNKITTQLLGLTAAYSRPTIQSLILNSLKFVPLGCIYLLSAFRPWQTWYSSSSSLVPTATSLAYSLIDME
jgi:hypothetical protein